MDFSTVIRAFGIPGKFVDSEQVVVGNINQTYKLHFDDNGDKYYIFQKVNTYVFTRPREVMSNIQKTTEYIRAKRLARGEEDIDRHVLHFLTTADGDPFVETEDGFWRAYHYVGQAHTYDMISKPYHFEQAGLAFGQFQCDLSDYPAETLFDTIPHFHDTPDRMRQFHEAIRNDKAGRAAEVAEEIEFFLAREGECGAIVDALASGKIPWRITHNDTKINNVLFDEQTDKAICVIDLDTVMPGSSLYDYGDAIRTGANTAGEDVDDYHEVHFDLELFEAFTKGYLTAAGSQLTPEEIEMFPIAAKMMTIEVATRFLADYLNGDVYFKCKKPAHNLIRTRNQIELARQMEQNMDAMKAIVAKYQR